jgi:uncharacterized membrane protein HdeD (DUF308 family)
MRKAIKHYIENYWWYFFLQAVVAVVFGLFALITPIRTLSTLILAGALTLIAFGVISLIRVFTEVKNSQRFGVNLLLALAEVILGFYLAFNLDSGFRVVASIVGVIVLVRGLFDVVVGMHLKDSGDKFMWVVAGIAGVTLGIVMLNFPELGGMMLFWLLGLYVLIFGLTNLFYAIRLRQLLNKLERKPAKRPAKKPVKKAKK